MGNLYMCKYFAIHAISGFRVKFNVEFTRQAVNVSCHLLCLSLSQLNTEHSSKFEIQI